MPHELRSDAAPLDMLTLGKADYAFPGVHGLRLEWEKLLSARPARKTSLFGKPALEAGRDEKAPSVVALSRVPRLAGFAGSPPAADPFAAVNRPLVRIPANQHTTTGTCEIGQEERYALRRPLQGAFKKCAAESTYSSCATARFPGLSIRSMKIKALRTLCIFGTAILSF
jgi:hypothetical protein